MRASVKRVTLPAPNVFDQATSNVAVRNIRRDGVLLIENVFTIQFVNRIAAAFQRQYCSLAPSELARQFALVGDQRYMITIDISAPFNSPRLYANDGVMPIFRELLGDDCLISSFGSVVAFPGAAEQPVHFDYPPLFESEELCSTLPPYALTMVVPLVDLNESTGSTAVWPGSHGRERARDELNELAKSETLTGASVPYAAKGDVLLMDFRLIHAGTANRSEHPRPILYVVYSRSWFREDSNFAEQPAINVSRSQLRKIPKQHRQLFAAAHPRD